MYVSNMNFKGYLGISAGNNKDDTTKVELTTVKVFNKSPSLTSELLEELDSSNAVFVDEMAEDAIDLIEAKRLVLSREATY